MEGTKDWRERKGVLEGARREGEREVRVGGMGERSGVVA